MPPLPWPAFDVISARAGVPASVPAPTPTPLPGAHTGPLLDVLLQLHRHRRTADLGQLIGHCQQAHAGCLAARGLGHFAWRLAGHRLARLGHRPAHGLGVAARRLAGRADRLRVGLRRQGRCLCGRWRRWRWHGFLFQHQLGQARRQFDRRGTVLDRPRHQQQRQAHHHAGDQHGAQDAAEARLVLERHRPGQQRRTERDGSSGGTHVVAFRVTANATSLKLARAAVYITLRSRR
ncbi:hypothetical protein X551_04292 [Methylibium sp. T29]|nr:hypothetical protein X551_04292 [Methylibium sp. T29]